VIRWAGASSCPPVGRGILRCPAGRSHSGREGSEFTLSLSKATPPDRFGNKLPKQRTRESWAAKEEGDKEDQPTLGPLPKKTTKWGLFIAYARRWTAPDIVVAVLLLCVTALQAWILVRQTAILEQQQSDTVEAGRITKDIRDAEQTIADATDRSADAIENSVTQAEEATKQALEEGKRSLQRTIEMARNDQRAWVGAVHPKLEVISESAATFSITLRNFGRTPASKVRHNIHIQWGPKGTPIRFDWPAPTKYRSLSVIYPGHEVTAQPEDRLTLGEGVLERIKSGDIVIYFSGEVLYDDGFGGPGYTEFACELLPGLATWRFLDRHNTAR